MALISDYEASGLKMPHIESLVKTQRLSCPKMYLNEGNSPWEKFFIFNLKDLGSSFLL